MSEVRCEKCRRLDSEHTYRELLTCLYGGMPLKDGGVFTRETADAIIERAFGDGEPEDGEPEQQGGAT